MIRIVDKDNNWSRVDNYDDVLDKCYRLLWPCMYMTIYFDHSNAIGAESALLMIIIICWGLQTYKKGNEIASSR